MQFQLKCALLYSLLLSGLAVADDKADIKQVFEKYHQVVGQQKTELVKDVFSAQYLQDHGGEADVKKTFAEKMKVTPYELEIQPGTQDKNLALVKILPQGKKDADVVFIMKRKPEGWRIEGTMTNDD